MFGFSSFGMRFGGGGSGGADQSAAKGLYAGLEEAGVSYNRELRAFMEEQGASEERESSSGLMQIVGSLIGGDGPDEPAIDYLTDEAIAQAKQFSDTALVVVGNDGVEMQDFTPEELRLTDNHVALLDKVTANFDNVIVVVNSGNVMELGFLDDHPQIRSALWIGTPGPQGTVSLGHILAGEVNPSGRLTSTYAYDVTGAPPPRTSATSATTTSRAGPCSTTRRASTSATATTRPVSWATRRATPRRCSSRSGTA
ncbi:hypothetical protein G7085_08555 [Tessaracoccus sp. HDW20]|nr:hypothetical protein [Tessaracoccus coleopterorum]